MDGRGLFRPAAQALSQDKESVKEQEVKRASSAGKELSQQIIVRPLECTTSAGQSEESTASRPLKKRIIAVDGLHLGLKTTGSEETTLEPI